MTYPHFLVVLDTGWFAIRVGLAYYDINADVYRPAFIDLVFWNHWRTSFEFARTQRLFRDYR